LNVSKNNVDGSLTFRGSLLNSSSNPPDLTVIRNLLGEMDRERQSYNREFSVFVRNLPGELDRFGLKGIFERVGRVCDIYIPDRLLRRNQKRFGFVRFK